MPAFRSRSKGRLKPLKPLGGQLGSLARELGFESALRLERLRALWDGIFNNGPLAKHLRPASFNGGRLVLEADSPAWLQQASFLKKDILKKLESFGIKEISFRLGHSHKRQEHRKDENEAVPRKLNEEEVSFIESLVSEVEDDGLRERVRAALFAWARRRRRFSGS